MIIAKCDICQKAVPGEYELDELREGFQTPEIKQVCHDCGKTVNDTIWKIRTYFGKAEKKLAKRAMIEGRKRALLL